MIRENISIDNIPAILWGENSTKIFIAVHGNMASKTDVSIEILAEEAILKGYQVLSFDLPEHGDRKNDSTKCTAENCVTDLEKVMSFARLTSESVSLAANSMGVYFSLLAFKDENLEQSLFISPVVDMKRIIENIMAMFDVSEKQLFAEKEIPTPIGETLSWDYYQYIKNNPIEKWDYPTAILYGEKDVLCEFEFVQTFAQKFNFKLEISTISEHYFHTTEDMIVYRQWLKNNIL